MLSLGPSQALEGVSTNATTVTYTICGLLMDNSAPPGAQQYQVLAQGQLAASAGSVYNPGGSNTALISSIYLFNTGGNGTQTCSLYIEGTAGSNQIISVVIPAGGWAEFAEGNGWSVYTASGLVMTSGVNFLNPPFSGTQVTAVANTHPLAAMSTATEAALTLGTISLYPLQIPVGSNIGHITFISGTTAFSTPTNWWFCLCDSNRNLLAITANQTTTAWAASTVKTLAIANIAAGAATQFTTTYSGTHYLGILETGTTATTLLGATPATTVTTSSSNPGGKSSTTGLTTPSTFPTQYGAISAAAFCVYAEAS